MLNGIALYVSHPGYLPAVNAASAAWKLAVEGDTQTELWFYAGPDASNATVRNLGFNRWPGIEGQTIRISFTNKLLVFTEAYRDDLAKMFTLLGVEVERRSVTFNNGQINIEGQVNLVPATV